ncbi:cDP-diacylglycerol-glycerol-3-phosphate 3-phosphatidyltransferase [Clostridium sp. CAG:1193]|jgi:CDP-diacylglycerol--glycerol-3-phosphate 3-phosphatidyltransferase|nr:cDP-diacylglycerol-glycerol-3-phosphate 3-phosphatidyltransferase [Clostridium sp. CAG:1193]
MNLPNRLTISRIILTVVIIIILTFPFYQVGIEFPMWTWRFKEVIEVDSRYIISGILFVIASFTDFLDGKIARKRGLVTDFGKFIDAIADKVLVNSVLILLATNAIISPIIPVVIIFRDTIVDSIRMMAANKGVVVAAGKAGKAKTAIMMVGLTLTFFYNLPFEIWNIDVSTVLLVIATVLSIYSGIEYWYLNKKLIFSK